MSEKRKLTSSDNLADLHIFVVPPGLWLEKYRTAYNNIALESTSAGFVRVQPNTSLSQLRDHVEDQIGFDVVPDDFVFLRSVGRCMAVVNAHQEKSLKVKHFLPPTAYSPEIFLLSGTHDTVFNYSSDHHVAVASEGHTTAGLSLMHHDDINNNPERQEKDRSQTDDTLGERQNSDDSKTSELMRLQYKKAEKPYYSDHESDGDYTAPRSREHENHNGVDSFSPRGTRNYPKHNSDTSEGSPRDDKQVQTDFDSERNSSKADSNRRRERQRKESGDSHHNNKDSPKSSRRGENTADSLQRSSNKSNDSTPENRKKTIRFLQPEVIPSPHLHGEVFVSPPTPIPSARVIRSNNNSPEPGHEQGSPRGNSLHPDGDMESQQQREGQESSRSGSRKKKKGHQEGKRSKHKKDRSAKVDVELEQEKYQAQVHQGQKDDDLPAEGDSGIADDDTASFDNGTPKQNQKKKNPLIHSKTSPALFNTDHQKRGPDPDRDLAEGGNNGRKGDKLGTLGEDEEGGNADYQVKRKSIEDENSQQADKDNSSRKGRRGVDNEDDEGRESRKGKKKGRKGQGGVEEGEENRQGTRGQGRGDEVDGNTSSGSQKGEETGSKKPETDSAKDKKRMEVERLKEELRALKAGRTDIEQDRERLVKKAKLVQSQTQTKRNQAKNIWKKKYFDEKKKTSPLEEQCNRLRYELEGQHRKLMSALEGKEKAAKRGGTEEPSVKSNQKSLLARVQHEKDNLRRKVEETQMQLAAQMKMRDSAQKELKELRDRTLEKKINVTLTKSQKSLHKPDVAAV